MSTITIDRAVVALEALREASLVWASPEVANAFSVLREALNAPQPQPVAPPRREPVTLTDEMVTVAARVLNDRYANECGVDRSDMWKVHGKDWLADSRAVLEAALKELNT